MICAAQAEYTDCHDKHVNIREQLTRVGSFPPTFAWISDLRGKHLYPLSHVFSSNFFLKLFLSLTRSLPVTLVGYWASLRIPCVSAPQALGSYAHTIVLSITPIHESKLSHSIKIFFKMHKNLSERRKLKFDSHYGKLFST